MFPKVPNNQQPQDWRQFPVILTPGSRNPAAPTMPQDGGQPNSPQTNQNIYSPPGGSEGSTRNIFIDAIRPILSGVAGTAAGGLGMAGGPVTAAAAGTGAYVGVNHLMNLLKNGPQPSFGDESSEAATNLATQEIGGKFFVDPMMRYANNLIKENINPGSVLGSISKLKPTFSQYYQSLFGPDKGTLAKWVEDIWSAGTKKATQEQSAQLADTVATNLATKTSGRTAAGVNNPEWMASQLQVGGQNQVSALYRAADKEAETAKLFAHANTLTKTASPLNDPFINAISKQQKGVPFVQLSDTDKQTVLQIAGQIGWKPMTEDVAGPINLKNSIYAAHEYLAGKAGSSGPLVPPDPESPMTKASQNILNITNAKFGADGKLTSADPISFNDAWDWKKLANDYGWGEKSRGTPIEAQYIDSRFKTLAQALDGDIETSMNGWKNGGPQATQAWRNASSIAQTRHVIFAEDGLRQLLENSNANYPKIDSIIQDPKQLQRALSAAEIKLPGGAVSSSNMRQDLKAYTMMKLIRDSTEIDNMTGLPKINGNKIYNQFNSPEFQEQRALLFGKNGGDSFTDLIKNLSITQQSGEKMGWYSNPKLWMTVGGMHLAGSLLNGTLILGGPWGAGPISARVLLGGMGKLMSNPTTAKQLALMAAGGALNQSDKVVGRSIVNALNGYRIALADKDGKETIGTIRDGSFAPELN